MTKTKRNKKATGGTACNHSKAKKIALIRPAQDAQTLRRWKIELDIQEKQLKNDREAFAEEYRAKMATLDERQRELDRRDEDRLSREGGAAAEKIRKPPERARMKVAADTLDALAPKQGELLTPAVSRIILMLYFGLVSDGISPNQAAIKVTFSGSLLADLSYRASWRVSISLT